MEQGQSAQYSFSKRSTSLPGSPIRALLTKHRDQDTLDLGGGIPDLALFPSGELADVARRVIGEHAAQSLQYAPTEGLLPLRQWIALQLNRRGCKLKPEQIIITHGSQQALATVASLLTSREQRVALEQPGYPGAQQAFMLAEADVISLPLTEQGWDLDALENQSVAALYVIPHFQNPTGRKASPHACRELVEYAERTGTFLIEDDAYGELEFEGNPPRPLIADAETRGILLGTFSKTLCPGMRVGWVAAPIALIEPMLRILQASSLQPGTLAQHLAWGVLEQIDWPRHLALLRATYRSRALTLSERCAALGLPSDLPRGGFFLWARTPGEATAFAERAASKGVFAVPELAFRHPRHPGSDQHLRLSFARYFDQPLQREKLQNTIAAIPVTKCATPANRHASRGPLNAP